MVKGTHDTETARHRSGGPGKAPRDGHIEGGKTGNAPGQNQPTPDPPADQDYRRRPGGDDAQADA